MSEFWYCFCWFSSMYYYYFPLYFVTSISRMVRWSLRSLSSIMKAVRVKEFGGPEVLTVESAMPIPECSDTQVLVRIMSAGINPVDTYIRQGTYTRVPNLPYTPGVDGAGIVHSVGNQVTRFKLGDRVFCTRINSTGTYAQFCSVEESGCWKLHENTTFEQGASVGVPYFTAYRALYHKCHAKPGKTVLIHGASGAVGLAAVQIGHSGGMEVVGTAGTQEGMELVKAQGADMVFNHKQPNYINQIMEATNGEGVDVVLEMLGNVNLGTDLTLVKQFGIVAIVGSRGSVEINPRLMMTKESCVVGVALMTASETDWKEMGCAISAGLEQGWLKPVVHRKYSLSQVTQAHKDIIESSGAKGKLVLSVTD